MKYATVNSTGDPVYSYMSVVSTLRRWAVITRALKGSGIITRPVGYRPPPRRSARLVAAHPASSVVFMHLAMFVLLLRWHVT